MRRRVDHLLDPVGVKYSEPAKLRAGERVAGERRASHAQRVEDAEDIGRQRPRVIARARLTGPTEPTSRDGEHVVLRRKLRSESVKHMCGIPEADEKYKRRAAAAPSENFQLDVTRDRDVHGAMRRTPRRNSLGRSKEQREYGDETTH